MIELLAELSSLYITLFTLIISMLASLIMYGLIIGFFIKIIVGK